MQGINWKIYIENGNKLFLAINFRLKCQTCDTSAKIPEKTIKEVLPPSFFENLKKQIFKLSKKYWYY